MAKLNLYSYILARHVIPDDDVDELFKILSSGVNAKPDNELSEENINDVIFIKAKKLYHSCLNKHTPLDSYDYVIDKLYLNQKPDNIVTNNYNLFIKRSGVGEKILTKEKLDCLYKSFIKDERNILLK